MIISSFTNYARRVEFSPEKVTCKGNGGLRCRTTTDFDAVQQTSTKLHKHTKLQQFHDCQSNPSEEKLKYNRVKVQSNQRRYENKSETNILNIMCMYGAP